MNKIALTYRRYKDGDNRHLPWTRHQVSSGRSYRCPTYLHRTPPCQAGCPSGHDVRGWLNIVRGLDKPKDDTPWEEYAFRRMTMSNPFPAIMGRVCPAPCEDGCNRGEIEDHVGINSIEHYIGNWALDKGLGFPKPEKETGKKVAIVGGGPAGLSAAYHLRMLGHACTVFDEHSELGGMMRYGIPGYRTPREVIDAEIQRIIDMGVTIRLETRIGTDVTLAEIEEDFDAVFWGIGAQTGKPLPVPGAEAANCVTGISFLRAFNEGRLRHLTGRVLVVGGGDTAMDVAAVSRRMGNVAQVHEKDRPESAILGQTTHDVAHIAKSEGADVWIVYRRPISKAPAARHEIDAVIREGVEIHDHLAPVEVILDDSGRAKALRVVKTDWSTGEMVIQEGTEFDIEAELIVGATGQAVDFTGFEDMDSGKGLMEADARYLVPGKPGHFVGGDAINPHLITSAVGHAWKASVSIDEYLNGKEVGRRPKVHVHHFDMIEKLHEQGLAPEEYSHEQIWGTSQSDFAVHNYEDRSRFEVVPAGDLFLGHFNYNPRHRRQETEIDAGNVLGSYEERIAALSEEDAIKEAERCMSCGLCFECDNCVIYCPQNAVRRVKKDKKTLGRYVETVYPKCIGCEICRDACPTGYIQMGLGE